MCRPIYFCKLGQITIIYNRISFCVIDSHVKCSLLTNPNFGFNYVGIFIIQFKTTNARLIIILRQRKIKQNDTKYWSYYLNDCESIK